MATIYMDVVAAVKGMTTRAGMVSSKWLFPRSHRFCLNCFRETVFIYSEKEDHSACKECGLTDALSPKNKPTIALVKKVYKKGFQDGVQHSRPIINIGKLCAGCNMPATNLFLVNGRWYCLYCKGELKNVSEINKEHQGSGV